VGPMLVVDTCRVSLMKHRRTGVCCNSVLPCLVGCFELHLQLRFALHPTTRATGCNSVTACLVTMLCIGWQPLGLSVDPHSPCYHPLLQHARRSIDDALALQNNAAPVVMVNCQDMTSDHCTCPRTGDSGTLVPVVFELAKHCPFGHAFALIGDAPQLGQWDVSQALKLEVRAETVRGSSGGLTQQLACLQRIWSSCSPVAPCVHRSAAQCAR